MLSLTPVGVLMPAVWPRDAILIERHGHGVAAAVVYITPSFSVPPFHTARQ